MSADSGDSLRIPIEIKTDDLDEIRKLINEISQAKSDLQTLKAVPKKGRGTGDTSSRSAFSQSDQVDNRGGIFGGQQGEATPQQIRDKKSKTPHQKESEFAKLRNQVDEVEQKQVSGADAVRSGLGMTTQGIGFAGLLGNGKGVLGAAGKMASKAFLPLAIITTIIEITSSLFESMLRPGGKLDRRYKRDFGKESARLSSMVEKQEISHGRRIVRVTSISSQRGTNAQVRSNLDYVKSGVDVFDVNGTFNKDIGVGSI